MLFENQSRINLNGIDEDEKIGDVVGCHNGNNETKSYTVTNSKSTSIFANKIMDRKHQSIMKSASTPTMWLPSHSQLHQLTLQMNLNENSSLNLQENRMKNFEDYDVHENSNFKNRRGELTNSGIMDQSRRNRITMKMDVAFTDHSHIIGKGGRCIQRVMDETGCRIHFPDSNRTSVAEKSNQVSIAGAPAGVEQSRCRIREMLPITVEIELPINCLRYGTIDLQSPQLQAIQQNYGFTVTVPNSRNFVSQAPATSSKPSAMLVLAVRGTRANVLSLRQGIQVLINYLCVDTTASSSSTEVTKKTHSQVNLVMTLDVAVQHHGFLAGRANANVREIMQSTGATIIMPDSPSKPEIHAREDRFQADSFSNGNFSNFNNAITNSGNQRKTAILIRADNFDSIYCAWQELLGYLPLILIFDLKEGQQDVSQDVLAQINSQLMEPMRSGQISILVNAKQRQQHQQNSPSKSIVLRGPERDARILFQIRRQVLQLDSNLLLENNSRSNIGNSNSNGNFQGSNNSNSINQVDDQHAFQLASKLLTMFLPGNYLKAPIKTPVAPFSNSQSPLSWSDRQVLDGQKHALDNPSHSQERRPQCLAGDIQASSSDRRGHALRAQSGGHVLDVQVATSGVQNQTKSHSNVIFQGPYRDQGQNKFVGHIGNFCGDINDDLNLNLMNFNLNENENVNKNNVLDSGNSLNETRSLESNKVNTSGNPEWNGVTVRPRPPGILHPQQQPQDVLDWANRSFFVDHNAVQTQCLEQNLDDNIHERDLKLKLLNGNMIEGTNDKIVELSNLDYERFQTGHDSQQSQLWATGFARSTSDSAIGHISNHDFLAGMHRDSMSTQNQQFQQNQKSFEFDSFNSSQCDDNLMTSSLTLNLGNHISSRHSSPTGLTFNFSSNSGSNSSTNNLANFMSNQFNSNLNIDENSDKNVNQLPLNLKQMTTSFHGNHFMATNYPNHLTTLTSASTLTPTTTTATATFDSNTNFHNFSSLDVANSLYCPSADQLDLLASTTNQMYEQDNNNNDNLINFLKHIGLIQYLKLLNEHSVIDLYTLLTLTENDLINLGLPFVHRRKLLLAISEFKTQFIANYPVATPSSTFEAAPGAERGRNNRATGSRSSPSMSAIVNLLD